MNDKPVNAGTSIYIAGDSEPFVCTWNVYTVMRLIDDSGARGYEWLELPLGEPPVDSFVRAKHISAVLPRQLPDHPAPLPTPPPA